MKPDRVGQQVIASAGAQHPRGRVERVEQPVADPAVAPVSAFSSVDLPAFV